MSESTDTTRPEVEPRWWQRLVPVTGLAVLVLGLAAFAFPSFDDEVELSTSRSPQPFVELFLTSRPATVCAGDPPQVRFRMVSHLQRVRTVGYRITVDPAGPAGPTVRDRGRIRLAPGQAKSVWRQVPAPPSGAYDITVRLQQRPERLRVHCDGAQR